MSRQQPLQLVIAVILIMLFLVGCGNAAPASTDVAPDFTLPDGNGNKVHLADELNNNQMVVLVFYHSYT
jgi:hypothetical protein